MKGVIKKFFVLLTFISIIFAVSCPNPNVNSGDVDESKVFATLDDFTISGFKDENITPLTLNIKITGAMFAPIDISDETKSDVSPFFSSNIDGLTYKITKSITGIGSDTLNITISGKPLKEVPKQKLKIAIKKDYINGVSKDIDVERGTYFEEIVTRENVVIPKVSLTGTPFVVLKDRQMKEQSIIFTLTDGTFDEAEFNKNYKDKIMSWLRPIIFQGSGLECTFVYLSEDKTTLAATISGTPTRSMNGTLGVSVPKSVLNVKIEDIEDTSPSCTYEIVEPPTISYTGSAKTLDGTMDKTFSAVISLRLENAKVVASDEELQDVSAWFKNSDASSQLPEGINASASVGEASDGSYTINIALSGTPTKQDKSSVYLSIPSSVYSYANEKLDEKVYEKESLFLSGIEDLKFNIIDEDGVNLLDENKKIVALIGEKNTNVDTITLKSLKLKFSPSIVGKDISSRFTTGSGYGGFKFIANELSDDGLTLTVNVEDARTGSQLQKANSEKITIILKSSDFESALDDKEVYADGFSYYIKNAPSITASSENYVGFLNGGETEALYTLNVRDAVFVNPQNSNVSSLDGEDVSAWFYNVKDEPYTVEGLSYTIAESSSSSVTLSVKGTPLALIDDADNQQIQIKVPSDYYEYADHNLSELPKSDSKVSNLNATYEIYDVSATVEKAVNINGKMGSELDSVDIKVKLNGSVKFKTIPQNTSVLSWFPEDVRAVFNESDVSVKYRVLGGTDEVVISVKGTPKATTIKRLKKQLEITIPSNAFNDSTFPALPVKTTVDGVACMWQISGKGAVVVEGMTAPIAAIYNHPASLNNTGFKLHLEDNYFDETYLKSVSNYAYRDWFDNLPSYLTAEVSFYDYYSVNGSAYPRSANVTIKSSTGNINYVSDADFGITIPDEALVLKDQGAEFDITSIPEVARKYCITSEPTIKTFKVYGSIYGIVKKDIEAFTNVYSSTECFSNTFGVQITLSDAYFSDEALLPSYIESWLSNYVHIEGLEFEHMVLNEPSVVIDGKRRAQSICLVVTGTPTEAKKAFSSTDGTRTLRINSSKGEFIRYTNIYAASCPITLTASTIAYHSGVSQIDANRSTDDGVYSIGVKISEPTDDLSQIAYGGSFPNVIMIENVSEGDDTSSDTTIRLKGDPADFTGLDIVKEGWLMEDYISPIETKLFCINWSSASPSDKYEKVYFTFRDRRAETSTSYSYDNVSIAIPGKYLTPSFLDYGGLYFKDGVPTFKIATSNST